MSGHLISKVELLTAFSFAVNVCSSNTEAIWGSSSSIGFKTEKWYLSGFKSQDNSSIKGKCQWSVEVNMQVMKLF